MSRCDKRVHRGPTLLLPVLMILASGTAFAHSKQEVTFPEDGAVLPVPPDIVSMRFDTPMRITVIRMSSETGNTFELERSDGMQPTTNFRATPPVLSNGRYTVEWRGLSSDGHPMKCRFSFDVAQ